MDTKLAIVAGHLCLDVIPSFADASPSIDLFKPGQLLNVGVAHFSTGGAVANTGILLNKFGIKTAMIGKIGDDLFGKSVLEIMGGMILHSRSILSFQKQTIPPIQL